MAMTGSWAVAPAAWALLPAAALQLHVKDGPGSLAAGLAKSCRLSLAAAETHASGGSTLLGAVAALLPIGLGLRAAARRNRCSNVRPAAAGARRQATETLQEGIAKFYNASTGVWVDIWGEHLHHGYYPEGFKGTLAQHQTAQVDMIEKVLEWSGVPESGSPGAPKSVLDVGCGVGGSSRHIQRKYGCVTTGITLSPKQRDQADIFSKASGQFDSCSFKVEDALKMPFADNSFDLIWSLESGEHMPRKPEFMAEMHRVCKPGGRIILVTWVHRELLEGEELKPREQRLLDSISKAYYLPAWCSISDYAKIAKDNLGMDGIRVDDWTERIKPFWGAVIRSALKPSGWLALWRGGWQTFRGALVMPLMARGYTIGTIKFGLLTATKKP